MTTGRNPSPRSNSLSAVLVRRSRSERRSSGSFDGRSLTTGARLSAKAGEGEAAVLTGENGRARLLWPAGLPRGSTISRLLPKTATSPQAPRSDAPAHKAGDNPGCQLEGGIKWRPIESIDGRDRKRFHWKGLSRSSARHVYTVNCGWSLRFTAQEGPD